MAIDTNDPYGLLALPECGGLLDNGRCCWLCVPACLGAACTYRMTGDSGEKVFVRLRSLSKEQQRHIAKKYYGGTMPWCAPPDQRR